MRGATVFLPSDAEWYKAAYYDPTLNSGAGGYTLLATHSNSAPTVATANATGGISNPGTNVANYANGAIWNAQTGNLTTVGSAGAASASYYGTFDQTGNANEWDEAVSGSNRLVRGGGYDSVLGASQSASLKGNTVKILVNDRLDVALAESAHGVHLGERSLPIHEAKKLAGEPRPSSNSPFLIGASCHTLAEAQAAEAAEAD